MVTGRHVKDNKNGKQVNFSFSKIWWASKVFLLTIGNDCVARSYRFSVPFACTMAKIRQKVYFTAPSLNLRPSSPLDLRPPGRANPDGRRPGGDEGLRLRLHWTGLYNTHGNTLRDYATKPVSGSMSQSLWSPTGPVQWWSSNGYSRLSLSSSPAAPLVCARYLEW